MKPDAILADARERAVRDDEQRARAHLTAQLVQRSLPEQLTEPELDLVRWGAAVALAVADRAPDQLELELELPDRQAEAIAAALEGRPPTPPYVGWVPRPCCGQRGTGHRPTCPLWR